MSALTDEELFDLAQDGETGEMMREYKLLCDRRERAIEIAVDAALGEVARQQGGIVEPVASEARSAGLSAGRIAP